MCFQIKSIIHYYTYYKHRATVMFV